MRLIILLLISSTLLSLTSFSSIPVEKVPQLTKQEQHLQKHIHRLEKRFVKTSNSRQQRRLQKRIKRLHHKQTSGKVPAFTMLAFIASVVGIIPLVFLLAAIAVPSFFADPAFISYIYFLFGVATVAFLGAALLFSILGLRKYSHSPDYYKGKKLAIAALVISIAGFLSIIVATLISSV